MENNEYVIVSKTTIEEKIKNLKESLQQSETNNDTIRAGIETHEIKTLEWCLSQSTPLIPEIEKAFINGCQSERRFSRRIDEVNNYISNLKLNI